MARGYQVVPWSLRAMVKTLQHVGDDWEALGKRVNGWTLDSLDVGPLGLAAGYPDMYNQVCGNVGDKVEKGGRSIQDAASALAKVADAYEERDAEYYKKFGYIEGDLPGEQATQRGNPAVVDQQPR